MHRVAVLLVALVSAGCGRSAVGRPSPELPPLEPPSQQGSALLGNWAEFHLGNCINDEAWLTFGASSELTVTSVDRNFCGPHRLAVSHGTYLDGAETLKLAWSSASGPSEVEASYAVLPRSGPPAWKPDGYQLGERVISLRMWHGGAASFSRTYVDRKVQDGKTHARDTRAQVTFDGPLTDGANVTATLKWQSRAEWGDDPARSLDETFTLPCRVKTEDGALHVRAVVLDDYDGFWKLLVARGLDRSYGWDLDRVSRAVGPDWVVVSDRLLLQARTGEPAYLELKQPPPTEP